jgi:hypothetical protein
MMGSRSSHTEGSVKVQKRLAVALTIPAFALSGCYVIPVGADGYPAWPPGAVWGPGVTTHPTAQSSPPPKASAAAPAPATLQARLYPANDIATQTGMVSGTVTNMMSGKGRFLLDYKGELLTGEATRVSGDERKGVASAYSPAGSYMSCEYQMNSPYQGAGTCSFSNGARYRVHIGN